MLPAPIGWRKGVAMKTRRRELAAAARGTEGEEAEHVEKRRERREDRGWQTERCRATVSVRLLLFILSSGTMKRCGAVMCTFTAGTKRADSSP